MTPLALRITNFRSVRGSQNFHFPKVPGLYFLQGINEVEPRLEANGSGKSTIWEALTWCWFGKTSKGLKAGDICNWDVEKGAEVSFIFMREDEVGAIYCMKRTWAPNTWTLDCDGLKVIDLAKEKDNPALSWLGLDFECWLTCILMAQGQPMFLDMKRDVQAALFSTVMGADRWLEYSATASKRAGDEDQKVREMERELARLEGELGAATKEDFRESMESWENTRQGGLKDIEEQHDDQMAKRKQLKADVAASVERETNARAWVSKAQADAGLEKDYNRAKAAVSDYEWLVRDTEAACKRAAADMTRFTEAKDDCPTCGSPMSAKHREKELAAIEKVAVKLHADAKKYVAGLDGARADLEHFDKEHGKHRAEEAEARAELDDALRELANNRRELDQCDRFLDQLEEKHDRLKAERNPYADMEERARENALRLRRDIDSLRQRMDNAVERQSLFQFWVRGFKDIRLVKIDEALAELEIEVNSCVDALGLVGWELQFQVDRETKGGKLERGFNCLVRSPANDKQVPWEAWSGGESQRLRVAGNMGLADLIRARTGAAMPLEIWDEPTDGLSPQGARDLLECLRERAQRERRVIFLVDHRTHDFGGFAGTSVVRKTTKGTIIESGIDTP